MTRWLESLKEALHRSRGELEGRDWRGRVQNGEGPFAGVTVPPELDSMTIDLEAVRAAIPGPDAAPPRG